MSFESKCYKQDGTYYITDDVYSFAAQFADKSEFSEHRHHFVELVYMMKGKGIHIIDGKEYPVGRGDLVMVNYKQSHFFKACSDGMYVNILMKLEYISQNLKNRENAFALLNVSEFDAFKKIVNESKQKVTFIGEERAYIEKMINALLDEISEENPGYRLAVKSMFNLILITVFRKMSFEMESGFDGVSEKLLSYISQNCDRKITLKNVAERCSYNPSYFSRIFKNATGVTFTAYLKKERIKKAEKLLEKTDIRITDIPWEVGYSDATAFFADFKKITGNTPMQYRKSKN